MGKETDLRPMLMPRETPDLNTLQYPILVFAKYDGIRCLIKDGVALSRTLKPIPNISIQEWAAHNASFLEGMDGELIVGPANSPTVYRDTNSFVMSHDKVGEFTFIHFDYWNKLAFFIDRFHGDKPNWPKHYQKAIFEVANNPQDILDKEESLITEGYEGAILRNPLGLYKFGRCTMKENNAYKLKRFVDDEAIITGFEEEMYNGNLAELNELGRTKRSTAKGGLSGKDSLGAFICRTSDGVEFRVGSGFTQADRQSFWENRESLRGTHLKYKHFPVGVKTAPRHPIFLGFRNQMDM